MRLWLLSLMATVSCASNAPTSPPATSSVDDSGSDVATNKDAAIEDTATPCPNEVGDILCDLPLEGYVRDGVADGLSTDVAYTTGTTLYEILARGTQKYAFIWTSGYW